MSLVYKLQNKLVSSFEGRALAIRTIGTYSLAPRSGGGAKISVPPAVLIKYYGQLLGGQYTISNIQPLHQICHISITHQTKQISNKTLSKQII